MEPRKPPLLSARLLDQIRERVRYMHYSLRTEQAYVYWARFFIRWHGKKHPRDMGAPEIKAFLTMLAAERKISASTHNQALSALLFMYREAKGGKDRVVMLPRGLESALKAQVAKGRAIWECDRQAQLPGVEMPFALDRKYPHAGKTWGGFGYFRHPPYRPVAAQAVSRHCPKTNRFSTLTADVRPSPD